MDRRRPAAVIGALCVSVAVVGGPVAAAQPVETGPKIVITDLPALSELPPLPADGGSETSDDEESDESEREMSGVETAALVLAAVVLVAGGLGLALVTRRGRQEEPDDQGGRPQPSEPAPHR